MRVCLSDDLCPVTDPLPIGIWNENKQIGETEKIYDFTKTRAYEVGYRINPMTPGLTVMSYSKFGDEIFEFGSSAFDVPQVLPPYTNPPFLPPPKNDSFIAPMPFIDFDTEKKDFNIPIIIGLILLGYFVLK